MRSRSSSLALLVLLLPALAWAQEQRCAELGAQCICNEQFNTGTYQLLFNDPNGAEQWDPIDTNTTKQCSQEAQNYSVIVENPGPVVRTPATHPAMFAALPPGHAISFAIGKGDGDDGRMEAGAAGFQSVPGTGTYPQINVRWYYYHSPNYAHKGDPGSTCENDKWDEWIGDGATINTRTDYTSGLHIFHFANWSPSDPECCGSGPGPNTGFPAGTTMNGKWFRWEAVIGPRAGSGFRYRLYGKNITDGLPEELYMDTDFPGSPVAASIPPSTFKTTTTNFNRFNGAGTCPGFRAVSHYMLAGFPTISDSNRIGAAVEVEGGGATPLNAPSGLTGCSTGPLCVP